MVECEKENEMTFLGKEVYLLLLEIMEKVCVCTIICIHVHKCLPISDHFQNLKKYTISEQT